MSLLLISVVSLVAKLSFATPLPLGYIGNVDGLVPFEPMTDEFEGTTLNASKWYPHNPHGWQGRPPAWFDPDNVIVKDGCLQLFARYGNVTGMPPGYQDYTTAAVGSTIGTAYGYFEIKAKPMNSAASSSFWFYNDSATEWTEIDVFELGGGASGFENSYNMNLHVMVIPPGKNASDCPSDVHSEWAAPFKFADEFHVFGFQWDSEQLIWTVDGNVVRRGVNTCFNQPLWLNFDSETMPDWFGLPDPNTLPSTYYVEYVRTWKENS